MLGLVKRVATYGLLLAVAVALADVLTSAGTEPSRFVGATLGAFLVLAFLVKAVRRFRAIVAETSRSR